jgi:hypothetical protein
MGGIDVLDILSPHRPFTFAAVVVMPAVGGFVAACFVYCTEGVSSQGWVYVPGGAWARAAVPGGVAAGAY